MWPLKIDPPDGKANAWNKCARDILEIAESGKWVRIVSLKKHYRHQVSKKTLEEMPPKFTDRTFDTLINIAFRRIGPSPLSIMKSGRLLENGSDK